MRIADLWVTQYNLHRADQIPSMVKVLLSGEKLPPILLQECEEDGEIEVVNGHHRLMAYWLSGRKKLEDGEYILQYSPSSRRVRRFTLEDN